MCPCQQYSMCRAAQLKEFEVPRDLCTLAFAYSNARVMEEGLFSDSCLERCQAVVQFAVPLNLIFL